MIARASAANAGNTRDAHASTMAAISAWTVADGVASSRSTPWRAGRFGPSATRSSARAAASPASPRSNAPSETIERFCADSAPRSRRRTTSAGSARSAPTSCRGSYGAPGLEGDRGELASTSRRPSARPAGSGPGRRGPAPRGSTSCRTRATLGPARSRRRRARRRVRTPAPDTIRTGGKAAAPADRSSRRAAARGRHGLSIRRSAGGRARCVEPGRARWAAGDRRRSARRSSIGYSSPTQSAGNVVPSWWPARKSIDRTSPVAVSTVAIRSPVLPTMKPIPGAV